MLPIELEQLVYDVQSGFDVPQPIAIMAARHSSNKELYQTLSSFSNQEDGGIILFGLESQPPHEVCGVYDRQDLQINILEQCEQMSPVVEPLLSSCLIDGRAVVSAEIPPMDRSLLPCFYRGKGALKGSFERIDGEDVAMSNYAVYSFEAFRNRYQDDKRPIGASALDSLDEHSVANFLSLLREKYPFLDALNDPMLLSLVGITVDSSVSLYGEFLFGICPQALFPHLDIVITDMRADADPARNSQRIEGNIPQLLDGSLSALTQLLSTGNPDETDEDTDETLTDTPLDHGRLPIAALKEALLNALVHRDYSLYTESSPIEVTIYDDRIEVKSPGGVFGGLPTTDLDTQKPPTRNSSLLRALEILGITDERYEGIRTMDALMAEAGLAAPYFLSTTDSFTAVLPLTSGFTEISYASTAGDEEGEEYEGGLTEEIINNAIEAIIAFEERRERLAAAYGYPDEDDQEELFEDDEPIDEFDESDTPALPTMGEVLGFANESADEEDDSLAEGLEYVVSAPYVIDDPQASPEDSSHARGTTTSGTRRRKRSRSKKKANETRRILSYCKVPRTREEIAKRLGVGTVSYVSTRYVMPLVNEGKLIMTIPDKPRSRYQKFVVPGAQTDAQ